MEEIFCRLRFIKLMYLYRTKWPTLCVVNTQLVIKRALSWKVTTYDVNLLARNQLPRSVYIGFPCPLWTMGHVTLACMYCIFVYSYLGLGHETKVCAVCLFIFLRGLLPWYHIFKSRHSTGPPAWSIVCLDRRRQDSGSGTSLFTSLQLRIRRP